MHRMTQDQLNEWLIGAVLHDKVRAAKMAIKNGAEIDVEDEDGDTPLHYAAHYGYIRLVKLLIENEAEVNHKNKDGKTPLYYAEKCKQKEIANLLKQHGGV